MGAALNIDWTAQGLVPTSGLLAWLAYDAANAADGHVHDQSGAGLHTVQASSPPVLTYDVWNGQPAWHFDGARNPLAVAATLTAKHIFAFAAADEAAFSTYRGLFSGVTAGNWLASNNAGTTMFTFSGTDYTYRLSDTLRSGGDWQAPVGGTPQLIEMTYPAGLAMDGLQIGQQLADATRKWKGYFFDALVYDRELTTNERRRVMLYYNLRYAAWSQGVPLYAPTTDLVGEVVNASGVPAGPRVLNRFYPEPPLYAEITDSFKYEDAMEDFNEVASRAPRRFEYVYVNVPKVQLPVFDEFFNQARLANPFYFRDPDGELWEQCRIEEYARTHEEHKRWRHTVRFLFRSNTGTVVSADTVGDIDDGGAAAGGATSIDDGGA